MSAPNTNTEIKKQRRSPSVVGISVAVVFAVVLLALFTTWTVNKGGTPKGADAQVDGRTGVIEEVQETPLN